MRSILISSISALLGLLVVSSLEPAQAANILIVAGGDFLAQTAASVLNGELTSAGNTVTVVNTGVPGSLAGFTQIYDTRYNDVPAFTVGEMNQYLAFLNASPGNTLFLMGENSGFSVQNVPITQFIALAGGGNIAAPVTTSFALETVHPPFTGPNAISTVSFAACGLVTSSGTGAFASSEAGGGCSLFFAEGTLANALRGALVVVFDVNFIESAPNPGFVNEIPFRRNLEQFVAAPPSVQPSSPPPAVPTPTLTTWGEILLALALCGIAVILIGRRAFA